MMPWVIHWTLILTLALAATSGSFGGGGLHRALQRSGTARAVGGWGLLRLSGAGEPRGGWRGGGRGRVGHRYLSLPAKDGAEHTLAEPIPPLASPFLVTFDDLWGVPIDVAHSLVANHRPFSSHTARPGAG